jgi:hypothetical protein
MLIIITPFLAWLVFPSSRKRVGFHLVKCGLNYATGNNAPWGSLTDVYDKPNPFGRVAYYFLYPNTKTTVI